MCQHEGRAVSAEAMSADRTSISSTAMSHMLHCIETRVGYKEILPLTVCARALARDPEEGWVPMLDYCNTSEGKKHFVIKHDFKTGLGEAQASDSRICSSIIWRCFTTSLTRPSSARMRTSMTL